MPARAVDGELFLQQGRRLVDGLLDRYLPPETAEPRRLHAAMRYSVMAGGKRLRPLLSLAAYEYCGGVAEGEDLPIHHAMAALEMVHTYSLIHDDLPCMDDDDLRRGIPTCHRKFDEVTAVLAGDALHDIAFGLLARAGSTEAVAELARAIGTEGMLGGQMADVQAEGRRVSREEVIGIHRRKTGALIRGAVRIGAILAGAERDLLTLLTTYGEKIGLAFQIVDDILDIAGDQHLLGKEVGADSKKQKATYPAAVGLQTARDDVRRLVDEALAVFDESNENMLMYIAEFIGRRQN
jgi:geranylgeranyl diphosphate synthase type II